MGKSNNVQFGLAEILISLGPGQKSVICCSVTWSKILDNQGSKIPVLTATLRMLFIAGPLSYCPSVESVLLMISTRGSVETFEQTTKIALSQILNHQISLKLQQIDPPFIASQPKQSIIHMYRYTHTR